MDSFIYKTTNIFTTEVKDKILKRYFIIGKILSILVPIVYCAYIGLMAINSNTSFTEYLATNPIYVLLFLASMLCIFVAYELKTIELHLVDAKLTEVITNCVLMIISQVILINLLYIALFALILYRIKVIEKIKIIKKISFKKVFLTSKLPILIILLNIFILFQALPK